MSHNRQIHIDPGIGHCVFGGVVIQVFYDTPESPSVCLDHHGFLWHIDHELQSLILKFLAEFSVCLIDQLLEINAGHLQLYISGAYL